MGSRPPKSLWQEAKVLALQAEKEIKNQNNFDPYKACMNCKKSMIKSLNSFLLTNNVRPSGIQTINVLMEQCREINPNFEDLQLSVINCRFELMNDDHCSDRVDLEKCVDVTNDVVNMTNVFPDE